MTKRSGFTMVELLVVVAITSLIGTVLYDYIIKSSSDNQKLESQTTVQTSLSFALDRVNRVLRSTTNVISADTVSLKVLAFANSGDVAPSQIYFYISSGKVLYDVIPASGTAPNYIYNPGSTQTFTLVPKVTNSSALPLFQYYDQTNSLLTVPVTLANVHAVSFLPSALDTSSVLTTPTKAQTYVTLRNFKTNL